MSLPVTQNFADQPTVKGVRFVLQICIAAVVLICANVVIARMSLNSVPRQILHRIDAGHDATLLAAGNSLMAVAFSEDTFRTAWGTDLTSESLSQTSPMNVALGASSPVEHLLLLRRALANEPKVKTVVYGFFDLQLTDKPGGTWADMTGNRAMSYYVEPQFAAHLYAPGSRIQADAGSGGPPRTDARGKARAMGKSRKAAARSRGRGVTRPAIQRPGTSR